MQSLIRAKEQTMQLEINRSPTKNSKINNLIEVFNISLPDFMSLYGVAAITKESGLLPLLSLKAELIAFEIYGDISGLVTVETTAGKKILSDIVKESVNIILGQALTKMKKFNVNSLLNPPKLYTDISQRSHESQFKVKYTIENDKIKEDIVLSFLLTREV